MYVKSLKNSCYACTMQLVFLINDVHGLVRIELLCTHKFDVSYKHYLIPLSSLSKNNFTEIRIIVKTSIMIPAIKISHPFSSKVSKFWSYAFITELI